MPECYFGSLPEPLHGQALGGHSGSAGMGMLCLARRIERDLSEWVGWLLPRYELWKPAQAPSCRVRCLSSSPVGSNRWKPALYNRTSMGGFSSARPSQRPSGSKQANQNSNLTRRNFSNKALEVSLEDLPTPAVGSQSCYCSLAGSLPSFDPLELALCVRCGTALP